MTEAPNSGSVFTRQQRIAELAKQAPQRAFTSLNHYLDFSWLYEAYRRTRRDGAPGVDGQTAIDDERDLEQNLRSLLDRAKSGTYRAPPVRRVHIPKGGSSTETRPIGIPTLEDKVLQRAVTMVLEAIYEQDFCDCSYGFRPKRSAHQALESLWQQTMENRGGWILEVDIRKLFDTLDRGHLRAFLQRRVRDGVLLRLIGKWCRNNRHRPIAEQCQKLREKLRSHYAYYGITGNSYALNRFREAVKRAWGKWLRRRRRKNRPPWSWFSRLLQRYRLPYAKAVHSVCRKRGVTT